MKGVVRSMTGPNSRRFPSARMERWCMALLVNTARLYDRQDPQGHVRSQPRELIQTTTVVDIRVLTPSYNYGHFIEDAHLSVHRPTRPFR